VGWARPLRAPDYLPANVGRGIRALFTTRAAGTQRAEVHQKRVAATMGVPVIAMKQVHGARVAQVEPGDVAKPAPVADALITRSSEIALSVLVADCVPVLLADERARIVAAIHAGRRGVEANVVGATIEEMRSIGSRTGDIRAVIGPAICGSCYEVPDEMRAEMARVIPVSASQTRWGTPALDLPGAVRWQLTKQGISDIDGLEVCTLENQSLYSYRRDHEEGRFAGVIRLEK